MDGWMEEGRNTGISRSKGAKNLLKAEAESRS